MRTLEALLLAAALCVASFVFAPAAVAAEPSIHCQIEADGKCHCGPRRGTGRQIPCRPEFEQKGPQPQRSAHLICDLQTLAKLVFERYSRPGLPIASVETWAANTPPAPGAPKTYLLIAQGIEDSDFWNYWLAQVARGYGAQSGSAEVRMISNVSRAIAGDGYSRAIVDAARKLPAGSHLILVGHSLGGIEHQLIVDQLKGAGYRVQTVIAFGSPVVASKSPGVLYRFVKARNDIVASADRAISIGDIVSFDEGTADLWDRENGAHHIYPRSRTLAGRALLGGPKPPNPDCLAIDLRTLREYPAPGLARAMEAAGPMNVHIGCANCFWSAIAQDLRWKFPGQPFQAPGQGNVTPAQIQSTLAKLYGPEARDPLHGPGGYEFHQKGLPITSSRAQIEAALHAAGPGSQGLVFFDHVGDGSGGHVINVQCVPAGGGCRVVFHDAQPVSDAQRVPVENEFRLAKRIGFYRTN
jgi:hypothetical protein